MSRYELTTHWHVDAPIDAVWHALNDVASWPKWWSYVLEVEELTRGDASGLGAVHTLTWGTAFPYLLTFTMRRTVMQRPHRIEAIFEGQLNGIGRWSLNPHAQGTEVRYDWEVTTAGAWMNMMSPLLGPMFRWNHGLVMADGARGLSRYLAAAH
jgi:carbon monoxide dehydrogenase subunit G